MESTSPAAARREYPIIRIALGLLFTYHALAITVGTLIPSDSQLFPLVQPWFRTYRKVTGAEQYWHMFPSAPNYASYDVVLIAQDHRNMRSEYGPVLPGLRPCNTADYRDNKLFNKLATPGYKTVRDAYFEAARREIEARTGGKLRALRLHFKFERLYNLARVSKEGRISFPESTDTETRHWN